MKKRIAIIGAGIGGLTLASRLNATATVIIFEKARGLGGRMSTRQAEGFSFDHGTQFFTARTPEFKQFLQPYLASRLVREWTGKVITLQKGKNASKRIWFEPHFVCSPGMNYLCKKLAEGISVHLNCEVVPLCAKTENGWELFDTEKKSLGVFDWVISTAPPTQTTRLFSAFLPPEEILAEKKMLACYALMIGIPEPWQQSWIAAKVLESPIEWISINSTKPGRSADQTALVIQTENRWAEQHVDDDQGQIAFDLKHELQSLLKINLEKASYLSLHRWRYAILDKAHDDDSRDLPFFDSTLRLASTGDWCARSRIEDVWQEANRLAEQIFALE